MRTSQWSMLVSVVGVALGTAACGSAPDNDGAILTSVSEELSTSATYRLVGVHSGRCVDIAGHGTANGDNVQLWDCHGGANQQFRFESRGNGYYRVRNVNSDRCLDVWGRSTSNGANVAQYSCNGGTNQDWLVSEQSGGIISLRARHSGQAIDAWEWGASNGTNLVQWPSTGGDNQLFYLVDVGGGSGGSGGSSSGGDSGGGSTTGCSSIGDGGVLNSTIVVAAGTTFDGGCKRYRAGSSLGDGSQSESQKPMFRLEQGATLLNVVLGSPAADGIHTYGDVTLRNITWEDVGEDALTIKSSGTVVLDGGSARDGSDKIFQINAASTFRVSNFTANNAGKFIRQNGGTTYRVDVVIDRCDISDMDEAIFRTDSNSSTVVMTNTRYRNIGDELFMGVNPSNITLSNNTQY